jgi:hypothetical protein
MRKTKRVAITIGALAAAATIGGAMGGAFSSTQAGVSTSPGRNQAGFTTSPGRNQAGVITSPGGEPRVRAGLSSSPGTRHVALVSRKAGKEQQEYLLAIPGVRGTGGGHTRSEG